MADEQHALVVEDDPSIRELLQLYLGLAGFRVEEEADGRRALERLRVRPYAFIVLDVMLPGLDGVSLCRAVRASGANVTTPVLMLTARDTEADIVLGLDSGADDHLTKPFSVRELQARIGAVSRRVALAAGRAPEPAASVASSAAPLVLAQGVTMDVDRREVRARGHVIELTRQEFDLLHQLASRRGIVFTRARLLQTVWADDAYVDERTVDTVISRLRRKIELDPREPTLILTARGVGYKFADVQ